MNYKAGMNGYVTLINSLQEVPDPNNPVYPWDDRIRKVVGSTSISKKRKSKDKDEDKEEDKQEDEDEDEDDTGASGGSGNFKPMAPPKIPPSKKQKSESGPTTRSQTAKRVSDLDNEPLPIFDDNLTQFELLQEYRRLIPLYYKVQ